jgi:type II secretory pathway pseudopilin PulG
MAIIAILVGLVLAASSGVMRMGGRARAKSEIKTMESALESYKSDNGGYPILSTGGFSSTANYTTVSPLSAGGAYQNSSAFLYEQLSGNTATGYLYGASATPVGHSYYTFKQAQLGNNVAGAGAPVYIKDPFGASYGYFAGFVDTTKTPAVTNLPYNGTGQYDIWSTAGDTTNPPVKTASWVTDWTN